jgi:hypothetical protein
VEKTLSDPEFEVTKLVEARNAAAKLAETI